jgi:hypothetical protein
LTSHRSFVLDAVAVGMFVLVVLAVLAAAWMTRRVGGYLFLGPALWSTSGVAKAALKRG